MDLLILRHGKALDREDWDRDDALRPLTRDGRQRTRRVLAALADSYRPLVIWSSPWRRARQTADIAADLWSASICEQPVLAGDGPNPASVTQHLAEAGDGSLLIVGHEPNLGQLVGHLVGADPIPLKKAGLAVLRGPVGAGTMHLRALLHPSLVLAIAGS